MERFRLCALLHQLLERVFVKTEDDLVAANHDRAADEIWDFCHELDGFCARGRLFLHVFLSIELIAKIQKDFVIASAYEFVEFGFAERFGVQAAQFKFSA